VDFGSSLTLTCPVTGCGTSPGAGTEWISLGPRALLATDATAVYAHEETRVTSCPFSGCVGGPIVLAGGLGRTSGSIFANPLVISDGTSIYFVDDGKTAPWVRSTGPRLLRCPASGCDAAGPTLLWSAPPAPNDAGYVPDWLALAVDDANVYFAARQVDGTTVLSMLLK
ncbi:MAG: hypothetical protein JWP87_3138, partial [Labilithrix sp.]|nr:hypothetical protein [Labilithrix sp.]